MTESVVILGRQPELGLAELERLYGADLLRPVSEKIAVLKKDHSDVAFSRLGGTVKLCKMLIRLETTHWPAITKFLVKTVPDHLQYIPEGKIRFGLNAFGYGIGAAELNRSALEVKKVIKNAGRSVRVVPNTGPELSSAQTLHNQLAGPTGMELVAIKDGAGTLLAQVVAVQDINAYAARDQARPKRDARVGMLPPKLAQIIVNLSGAQAGQTVLDPFCGTGVVLQEAILGGCSAYGSDVEPRMIDFATINLKWLAERFDVDGKFVLEPGDATDFQWQNSFDTVATETYLGRPFSAEPKPDVLGQVQRDVDTIHRKFLKNLVAQTPKGFQLCLAVPAWKTKNGFKHLSTLDSLEDLGYTRMSFVHTRGQDLIYHREGQFVGRELVVLTRK